MADRKAVPRALDVRADWLARLHRTHETGDSGVERDAARAATADPSGAVPPRSSALGRRPHATPARGTPTEPDTHRPRRLARCARCRGPRHALTRAASAPG